MTPQDPSGFRLHYFRDLQELRPVTLDGNIPRLTQEHCPACLNRLRPLAILTSGDGRQRVRLGCCERCGYRGYMDRPAPEWFSRFYLEEWDNARRRDAGAEARRLKPRLSDVQRSTVALAARLAPDPNRPLCEIGCGLGSALKEFEALGFSSLIGVEPSRFRSEVARAAFGYRIITGAFDSAAARETLRADAPIGVLYSFHALEHVYDPGALIAAAADLQSEDDLFVVAVPNAEVEAPVMTLFWLPHLHAFSAVALERLLNRHGYKLTAREEQYPDHLILAARRTDKPKLKLVPQPGYLARAEAAIRWHFRLSSLAPGRRYRFSWKKKTYRTAIVPAPSSPRVDWFLQQGEGIRNYLIAHLLRRFYAGRSLVMSALPASPVSSADAPIEVAYEGPIQLLVR